MALPASNDAGAREFLKSQNWPTGLIEMLIQGFLKTPIRFIIVDNSGSMASSDGQQIINQGNQGRFVKCSRWTELTGALRFHAALAEAARAPTEFRLLNNALPILLGVGDDNGQKLHQLFDLFDQSPSGGTPLCRHIGEIVAQITALAPQLYANNQKAVLIIASDGEASDGDVSRAMEPLKNLPVWVVIRLCTGEERICEYWSNIDKQLEIDMDVLDDLEEEAKEIHKVNDWITYGEPLHRLREFGIILKDMDMLDETALSPDQMRSVMAVLLTGGPASEVPHPAMDWSAFTGFVKPINDTLPKTWSPMTKSMQTWVLMSQLQRKYGPGGGGASSGGGGCCVIS